MFELDHWQFIFIIIARSVVNFHSINVFKTFIYSVNFHLLNKQQFLLNFIFVSISVLYSIVNFKNIVWGNAYHVLPTTKDRSSNQARLPIGSDRPE